MGISPEVLSTLLGVAIGSISTLAVTWISKRSEERRHTRELAMNAAIVNWKTAIELGQASGGGKILPLSLYMVHMLKISDLLTSGRLSKVELPVALKEADEVLQAGLEYILDRERP